MLARALGRTLRSPTGRIVTTSSRINLRQWSRSLASNSSNKKVGASKSRDWSKPSGSASSPSNKPSADTQKTASSGTAASAFGTGQPASSRSEPAQYSNSQGDVNETAAPQHNTNPEPSNLKSEPLAHEPGKSNAPADSHAQSEFQTTASPEENATNSDQYNGAPLPDLTQGIPSTLAYELEQAQRKTDAATPNITEEGSQESDTDGAPKRPRGELPASAYVSSSEKKRLKVANYMYASAAVALLAGYTYLGRNWETEEEEQSHVDAPSGWSFSLMWKRAMARLNGQLSYYHEPAFKKLLPDPDPMFERPYTLVLSLEDLLIHSEWSRENGWRMAKRPGIDFFLRYLSQYYELVVFTSIPWSMGDPVIKKLDPYHIITWPLFREATNYKNGEYVKDLSYLNRDLSKVIMVDTEKAHASGQPENAIILPKWKGSSSNENAKDLVALVPFLEYVATMHTPDVRTALKSFEGSHIPTEFARREAIARKKFQEQLAAEQAKRPKSGLGFLSGALGVNKPMLQLEPGEQSAAEGLAQGKMLQDMAREKGMRNYEALEKMIRENGEQWLKEEKEQEEAAKQEGMKAIKGNIMGVFGGAGGNESGKPAAA